MPMHIRTTRMEAFSDGVIAIIITVMIFDIKFRELAHDFTHQDVMDGMHMLWPKIVAYFFSFLILGIMWLNHHHMFHLVQLVDEKLMWLNLHLLFWMSLIPLPTSMIGRNPLLPESAAIYGGVLGMTAISFTIMRHYVDRHRLMHQGDRKLDRQVDKVNSRVQLKNFIGIGAYVASAPLAYVSVFISYALILIPAVLFFIPEGVAEASDDTPPAMEEDKEARVVDNKERPV